MAVCLLVKKLKSTLLSVVLLGDVLLGRAVKMGSRTRGGSGSTFLKKIGIGNFSARPT